MEGVERGSGGECEERLRRFCSSLFLEGYIREKRVTLYGDDPLNLYGLFIPFNVPIIPQMHQLWQSLKTELQPMPSAPFNAHYEYISFRPISQNQHTADL